ncbi:Uma2 family endonuclease [Pseudanabaena sp. UWO311]|uniref:Uma2 family endonuclease n=1 Tax=Pseudanabaena sp. UWO311 TaxID=2487337 RepID=UPI00115B0B31|nr:Uma2 family endonuclease [Pseudanabaena sp. UWO311]TYQ28976.1 Uma2 family endonuclease [Pseudanabaena sp. UWO311]
MTAQLLVPSLSPNQELPNPDKPHVMQFTVEQFQLMYERGVFADSDRYELINGEIIAMSPIGIKHAVCVGRLTNNLVLKLGARVTVWVQNPIDLANKSQPQPDIAVLKYRDDFYEYALPTPADILLIIEVADSSLEYDRDVKTKLYGVAGIPQMWLFDVNTKTIMGFSQPSELGYKQTCLYTQGDRLSILAFDDVVFEWQELF